MFYVAITRAEQNCVLSYAKSRYRNGKTDMCTPSRFLKDIDAKYPICLRMPALQMHSPRPVNATGARLCLSIPATKGG